MSEHALWHKTRYVIWRATSWWSVQRDGHTHLLPHPHPRRHCHTVFLLFLSIHLCACGTCVSAGGGREWRGGCTRSPVLLFGVAEVSKQWQRWWCVPTFLLRASICLMVSRAELSALPRHTHNNHCLTQLPAHIKRGPHLPYRRSLCSPPSW